MKITIFIISLLILSCTSKIEMSNSPEFYNDQERGKAVEQIQDFDNLMKKCYEKKNRLAKEYNEIAGKSNLWDFANITLGLIGQAALAILVIDSNYNKYSRPVTISFNASSVLATGIKVASGINTKLNDKKSEYDVLNGKIENMLSTFTQARERLYAGDTTGKAMLNALMLNVRKECPACYTEDNK
jgi:hypothetical protein